MSLPVITCAVYTKMPWFAQPNLVYTDGHVVIRYAQEREDVIDGNMTMFSVEKE